MEIENCTFRETEFAARRRKSFAKIYILTSSRGSERRTRGGGSYLIEPFPLERNGDFDEDGDDPCEVNVAHDLGAEEES